MKILVIGNGFDLEHDLPTMYKDFLDFVEGILKISSKKYVNNIEAFKSSLPYNIHEKVKEYLIKDAIFYNWEENYIIEELICLSENNIWMKYFIKSKFRNEGWIDLEAEISYVIKSLDCMKKHRYKPILKNDRQMNSMQELESNIIELFAKKETNHKYNPHNAVNHYANFYNYSEYEYTQYIIQPLINDLNYFIRCLEIYLEECVGQIDINYVSPDIKEIKFDKVLSFNYTNTYERIYANNNDLIEYDYIHGKAEINRNIEKNNMVLGIDEYLDKEVKDKELEFISFKKYFQRIYKMTGNEYKKWTSEMKNILYESTGEYNELGELETQKITNQIYIFGHSLDVTDKDIIKELIECKNTETTIFYYNKEVYAQHIANLVKIIGQDELIKRVSGAEPTIIFKQQQKRIEKNN